MTTSTEDKGIHRIKEGQHTSAGSNLEGSGTLNKSHERNQDNGTETSILDRLMGDAEDFRVSEDLDGENEGVPPRECVPNAAMTPQRGNPLSQIVITNARPLSIGKGSLRLSSGEKRGVPGHLPASQLQSSTNDLCRQHVKTDGVLRNSVQAGRTRYFIIKSLNHYNFEQSVQNGIWATQAMNERTLNEAFKNAERVLLIFSVNMSGHFQGYAQMMSLIGQTRALLWNESNWGGTFNVEWIRLYNLPFQRTIHLKNPLNSFKPVKISRDCQELTEEIGEALCALIDDGAEGEERAKRKTGNIQSRSSKKACIERMPWASSEMHNSSGTTIHTECPWSSLMYPYGFPMLFSNLYSPQVSVPMGGFAAPALTANFKLVQQYGGSTKRSLVSGSPRKNSIGVLEREGIRDPLEGQERESSKQDTSSFRVGLGPQTGEFLHDEDDFLNMTYEEYLQHVGDASKHGHHQQGVTRLDDDCC